MPEPKGTPDLFVCPSVPEDVEYLGSRLRQADVDEITANGGSTPHEALEAGLAHSTMERRSRTSACVRSGVCRRKLIPAQTASLPLKLADSAHLGAGYSSWRHVSIQLPHSLCHNVMDGY